MPTSSSASPTKRVSCIELLRHRLDYEVCVLQALREKIRVRDIWIVGADRFRNPDEDLLTDFSQKRKTYYEALRQPTEAEKFIERLKEAMRRFYQAV